MSRPTIQARLRDQDGFTVVEALVAILILATGVLATLGIFDVSRRNTFHTEQFQVAVNRAQEEMEQVRRLDWDEVALTSAPVHSNDPNSPFYRVNGNNFSITKDGANPAEMVVGGVGGLPPGTVNAGPTPFQSGDVSGQVYRFVVWRDDAGCLANCAGTHDYKRVIVIVQLDTVPISFAHQYDEVQSDFIDPEANVISGGGPGSGGQLVTAEQLFFSDTRCDVSGGDPLRIPPADHATHDTLGTCAASSTQKPDALLSEQPPDPDPADPANPAKFDYATELEPSPSNADRGLQLMRQDSNGCQPTPTGDDASRKVHRFVTKQVPLDFVMTGSATLELYTRTIDDVSSPGGICVYLYRRSTDQTGTETRTPITLTSISPVVPDPFQFSCSTVGSAPSTFGKCSTAIWPKDAWQRIRFNLGFASNTELSVGERLELNLSVERAATPQETLQFMYDHPETPARLEVKTVTPLP